jgi:hypothetical protein
MTEPIDPEDWALVVCISAAGKVQVYGLRTPKSVAALRMVADSMEQHPSSAYRAGDVS